jgi:2-polyprenyl-3-methyl-5-hydroxy-6-metoxy-1,4-benzoquinol methylase
MEALRPKVFVELGTHNGFSYFCFCQSVKQFDIGTRCYAVDTWKGDEFTGYYSEEVFNNVQVINQTYSDFSQLFRMTFDDALNYFSDGSIDLLHIDGSHLYGEVKHDFESWRKKLSGRAILLFHDTNVREQNFGVWRLFEELKADHPAFEFKHGYGLGVLSLGEIPLVLARFFNADAVQTDLIRLVYARLGAHISRAWLKQRELRAIGEALERTKTELAGTAAKLTSERVAREGIEAKAQQEQQQFLNERTRYTEELDALRNELAQLQQSTFWRATGPIRAALNKVPIPLRYTLRRGAKAVYWALTPYRMPARVAFLRARAREVISHDPEPLAPEHPESGGNLSKARVSMPDDLLLKEYWYHTIELTPGVFTPGQSYTNVAITRELLKNCQVEGQRCLDIGTMEGLVSVLLARRKAAEVFAADRLERHCSIQVVKRTLGVDFTYLPSLTLTQLRRRLPEVSPNGPMDLIVFSGVLYHMYDPMQGLALVRSMARPGGLVIIETYAAVSHRMTGYFNAAGRMVGDCHNYWTFSVALLDYLLRYFRLCPLDCRYFDAPDCHVDDGSRIIRLGVVCRATEAPLPEAGDHWMIAPRDDDSEYPDWPTSNSTPTVPYRSPAIKFARESGAVDVHRMVLHTAPTAYGPRETSLSRDQIY